jgi:hypothetical protein
VGDSAVLVAWDATADCVLVGVPGRRFPAVHLAWHAMIPVVYGWVRRILGSSADPHAEAGNWPTP